MRPESGSGDPPRNTACAMCTGSIVIASNGIGSCEHCDQAKAHEHRVCARCMNATKHHGIGPGSR